MWENSSLFVTDHGEELSVLRVLLSVHRLSGDSHRKGRTAADIIWGSGKIGMLLELAVTEGCMLRPNKLLLWFCGLMLWRLIVNLRHRRHRRSPGL